MNGKKAKELRAASSQPNGELNVKRYKQLKRMARVILTSISQAPKFEAVRQRLRFGGIGPTWPNSVDQKYQSRPVIVEKPVRALVNKLLEANKKPDGTHAPLSKMQRALLKSTNGAPKFWLDAIGA